MPTAIDNANTAAALNRAANLIASQDAWCQKSYAQNSNGVTVEPDADAACKWCMMGALEISAPNARAHRMALVVLGTSVGIDGFLNVGEWNDKRGRTQAEAVTALRDAAAIVEAR